MQQSSYFLKVVPMNRPRSSMVSHPRENTDAQKQNPVGWAFFSFANVRLVLDQLARDVDRFDFNAICSHMCHVYETRGREFERMHPQQLEGVDKAVHTLNAVLFERIRTLHQSETGRHNSYVSYLKNLVPRQSKRPTMVFRSRVENKRTVPMNKTATDATPQPFVANTSRLMTGAPTFKSLQTARINLPPIGTSRSRSQAGLEN